MHIYYLSSLKKVFSKVFIVFLGALTLSVFLPAKSMAENFGYARDPLTGASNLMVLTASGTPPVLPRKKKGDWKWTVGASYYLVDQLYNDLDSSNGSGGGTKVRGDNMSGSGGSILVNYGLSDRWQFYGLIANSAVEGTSITEMSVDGFGSSTGIKDAFEITGKSSVTIINVGLGYDLVADSQNKKWSIPISFGLMAESYKSDMNLTPFSDGPGEYLDIEGSGMLTGVSVGITGGRTLGRNYEIIPFFLWESTFDKMPELTVTVTRDDTTPPDQTGDTETISAGAENMFILGATLRYRPWDVYFGLRSIVTEIVGENLYNGLKVTSFSISKTF